MIMAFFPPSSSDTRFNRFAAVFAQARPLSDTSYQRHHRDLRMSAERLAAFASAGQQISNARRHMPSMSFHHAYATAALGVKA